MKKSELKSLINECIQEVLNEDQERQDIIAELSSLSLNELKSIKEGIFSRMLGTEMGQDKAEKIYAKDFAGRAKDQATKLGTDVETYKAALIKYLMNYGGAPSPNTAKWNAEKKEFEKLPSKGGVAPAVYENDEE